MEGKRIETQSQQNTRTVTVYSLHNQSLRCAAPGRCRGEGGVTSVEQFVGKDDHYLEYGDLRYTEGKQYMRNSHIIAGI